MIYSGMNQEDSAIINKAAAQRGLFQGCAFIAEKIPRKEGEIVGPLNQSKTTDIKKNAIHEYVDARGLVKPGTMIQKNQVMVSKCTKLSKPINEYLYSDRSVVYTSSEPARITDVREAVDEKSNTIYKISMRKSRNIVPGDKISSTSGNKSIVATMMEEQDMPITEDGIVPDVILNPHAVPTRMVIGQLIAGLMGELAARKGSYYDAGPFSGANVEDIIAELAKYGIVDAGMKRMYNGITGDWIEARIFLAPTGYQRLQKFVADESYAMFSGPTAALTRQPTDGRSHQGGQRIGEMEKDTILGHGANRALSEKFGKDSDGIISYWCRICSYQAIVNEAKSIYICKQCGDDADIVKLPTTWCANLLMNGFSAMGANVRYGLCPAMD